MAIRKASRRPGTIIAAAVVVYVAVAAMAVAHAQGHGQGNGGHGQGRGLDNAGDKPKITPTSLKSLTVTEPPDLADFVRDRQAAIVLGKALFWDQQVGSDGLACASCHFHAGADNRIKNQIDPDVRAVDPSTGGLFSPMASGDKGGPNYTLTTADFPFHQLADPTDRESAVLYDTNNVVSSIGVFGSVFVDIGPKGREHSTKVPDPMFNVGGIQTRRVEPRNTPTVINAVLNFRNFWDGRANDIFNGVNPFGPRDTSAHIWVDDRTPDANGVMVETAIPALMRMQYASAASQAVGPALSDFEMSSSKRAFPDLGRKLLRSKPLKHQEIALDDSVLAPYRDPDGRGLNTSYEVLIQQAFWPDFWQTPDAIFFAASHGTDRQIEANFSMFWGIAIQMYEATLISDDSRFDQFADGNFAALTPQERVGLALFNGKGHCVECHKGAEFTGASTRLVIGSGIDNIGGDGPIEQMAMNDGNFAYYDNGFYNIGVVPAGNDIGVGGSDPFGYPLSYTRQLKLSLLGLFGPDQFFFGFDPCTFQAADGCSTLLQDGPRDAVDGSFKVPSLRNVELTGPYFHNGGYATLEQVLQFYDRGGNVRATANGDTTGLAWNTTNLDLYIRPLNLSDDEEAALVAFLKSLTDERVRWERAPFDHPSLKVPNGHVGDNYSVAAGPGGHAGDDASVAASPGGHARDEFLLLPAVGRGGLGALGLPPLQRFTPAQPR